MLASDVLTRARNFLNDENEPYRWADATLLFYLTDALRRVRGKRPDLFYSATGAVLPVPNITSPADTLTGIVDGLTEPLAHYVSARAYEADAEDAANTVLAEKHMDAFLEQL